MKYLKLFLSALGAGTCIGIGGLVFLAMDNKFAGAFLFAVGLLTILIFGFNLYTGMVGYLKENLQKKNFLYMVDLLVVWLGNYAGTACVALLARLTGLGDQHLAKCSAMAEAKISQPFYALIILGFFCGILMYLAVDTFKKKSDGKDFIPVIAVFMGVMVFILAGFEHSIADMFYFTFSGHFVDSLLPLLCITLGNSIGGNLIPLIMPKK